MPPEGKRHPNKSSATRHTHPTFRYICTYVIDTYNDAKGDPELATTAKKHCTTRVCEQTTKKDQQKQVGPRRLFCQDPHTRTANERLGGTPSAPTTPLHKTTTIYSNNEEIRRGSVRLSQVLVHDTRGRPARGFALVSRRLDVVGAARGRPALAAAAAGPAARAARRGAAVVAEGRKDAVTLGDRVGGGAGAA